jgi:hypothetical protein
MAAPPDDAISLAVLPFPPRGQTTERDRASGRRGRTLILETVREKKRGLKAKRAEERREESLSLLTNRKKCLEVDKNF